MLLNSLSWQAYILIIFQTKEGGRQSQIKLGKKCPIFANIHFCRNAPCSTSIFNILVTFCIQQESPCPCTASFCTGGYFEIDYSKMGLTETRFKSLLYLTFLSFLRFLARRLKSLGFQVVMCWIRMVCGGELSELEGKLISSVLFHIVFNNYTGRNLFLYGQR